MATAEKKVQDSCGVNEACLNSVKAAFTKASTDYCLKYPVPKTCNS
jgi:hypothetical protein